MVNFIVETGEFKLNMRLMGVAQKETGAETSGTIENCALLYASKRTQTPLPSDFLSSPHMGGSG